MARDLLYYVDKNTRVAHELGEIQSDFNMNIVIDGTKDSFQCQVYDFNGVNLQPYTLICHKATNTWWIVKSDKVKRYTNEQGYYYQHNLALQGAIELLNARDLTDCGFNANTYTIDQFIKRLFKLSTFEWTTFYIHYGTSNINVDKDKVIDFVKSYENYTLLSALKDFLNCFNCEIKMRFLSPTDNQHIGNPTFDIIPRTGDISKTAVNISAFDDIRETKNFDKDSFGTTVVSNAQNVIGTQAKTVPLVGGFKLTGEDYQTTNSSAYIRLPSNAWKVNWLKAITPVRLYLGFGTDEVISSVFASSAKNRYLDDSFEMAIEELCTSVQNSGSISTDKDEIIAQIRENKEKIRDLCKHSSITFYNNPKYNPDSDNYGTIIKEENTPYITVLDNYDLGADHKAHQVALMDKESHNLLRNKNLAFVWERGSNKITNFGIIGEVYKTYKPSRTDLFFLGYSHITITVGGATYEVYACYDNEGQYDATNKIEYQHLIKGHTIWQVNYIPMSDLKVKQDNDNNTNDIKLYNQNGKLNDSVGLSKIIDSHSKEIQNETITRYMHYHKFSDIPTVGTMVNVGGDKYVINNISYDFYMQEQTNDNVSYYIDCEFTIAPYISTKSIMTNPNTNVRDYGIPQQYNVNRRQTYRDYWSFSYVPEDTYDELPYYDISKIINFYANQQEIKSHTAFIKITYDGLVDNSLYWYYQLPTTIYSMAKSFYEVVNFNDNNIVGYDTQNSTTGFDMSHIWQSDKPVTVTTPVSYVDDNGRFKGVDIQFLDEETTQEVYESQTEFSSRGIPLSTHPFINEDIYYSAFETEVYNGTYSGSEVSAPFSDNFRGFYINLVDFDFVDGADKNSTEITSVSVIDDYSSGSPTLTDFTIEKIYDQYGDLGGFKLISNNTDSDPAFIRYSMPYNITINYTYNKPLITKGDYQLSEPNYNKDSIEVPVFQYSCQVGDTKDIECGDQFFNVSSDDYMYLYTFVIRDKNTTTQLNIGQWATNNVVVAIDGTIGSYSLANGVQITTQVNSDNKTIGFRFYLYGSYNVTTSDGFIDSQGGNTRYNETWLKNNIVGKDLAIYRYVLKDKNGTKVEKQLLFLMHDVKENNILSTLGGHLLISANYYKLK